MSTSNPNRFSIAPMMAWTDRHYRFMARLLTKETLLYTEMVVSQTLRHRSSNLDPFLGHSDVEHPLALQVGGNEPELVRQSIEHAESYGGFTEYNLNVGCPSARVSVKGEFGARLMLKPELVRDITREMIRAANGKRVTIKCRLGVDDVDSYESLHDFIRITSSSGVTHYIIHARKCLLKGLSTKANRNVPPLKYDFVMRLVSDFPHLEFSLNGGVQSLEQASELLLAQNDSTQTLAGVMVGRAAYNNPWMLRDVDTRIFNAPSNPNFSRKEIVAKYLDYAEEMQETFGTSYDPTHFPNAMPTSTLIKPLIALFAGENGGKNYRKALNTQIQRPEVRKNEVGLREVIEHEMHQHFSEAILNVKPSEIMREPEREI